MTGANISDRQAHSIFNQSIGGRDRLLYRCSSPLYLETGVQENCPLGPFDGHPDRGAVMAAGSGFE